MANPYKAKPAHAWWSRSVARPDASAVDPVVKAPFTISRMDAIATAGSCFAQHIARTLVSNDFHYLVTEQGSAEDNFGIYPARFGNIYTVRQLLQLIQRAYGLLSPSCQTWVFNGRFVDPFRPQVHPKGFAGRKELAADGAKHMAAVRSMFERCSVFVFTLGLTEGWRSTRDGSVVPLAPGVAGSPEGGEEYEFWNADVSEMMEDFAEFVTLFRLVNPSANILLTVSPVPLIATFEDRHALTATTYSKAALRVVAEYATRVAGVHYFPSYEIITGHHTRYRYYDDDLRTVTPEGVDRVMHLFKNHFLSDGAAVPVEESQGADAGLRQIVSEIRDGYQVVCDEEATER